MAAGFMGQDVNVFNAPFRTNAPPEKRRRASAIRGRVTLTALYAGLRHLEPIHLERTTYPFKGWMAVWIDLRRPVRHVVRSPARATA